MPLIMVLFRHKAFHSSDIMVLFRHKAFHSSIMVLFCHKAFHASILTSESDTQCKLTEPLMGWGMRALLYCYLVFAMSVMIC